MLFVQVLQLQKQRCQLEQIWLLIQHNDGLLIAGGIAPDLMYKTGRGSWGKGLFRLMV
ncbi:hypothetical protein K9N68_36390 (plasmid) [Kovacikia minuta CCNUW1]|uniref:hypothetical protein n=1 Tax=Kovacikia minuta TaxID=2931930 RepID=UPI001CD003FA|nr:hypothetical protein [Kovacikia minuta]UBF30647.1 hypothetical protein K9N68_36390 [Kovacikia minuta CCNUW1]